VAECLENADVFWNETPEAGPETIPQAIRYGVEAGRPLASWLDAGTLSRVEKLAETLDVPAQLLAAVRPWLACQLLQNAAREQAGIPFSNGVESVLANRARQLGIAVHHEFATLEEVMKSFVGLSSEAEIGYLSYYLDELEELPEACKARRARWARGDLALDERRAERTEARYPAFYEELVVSRNLRWVRRIEEVTASGKGAFLLIGTGHLVGPGNLIALLAERNLSSARL
jgi:uncharacterized protein YbaP (TraB family)